MAVIKTIQKNQSFGSLIYDTEEDISAGTAFALLVESPDGIQVEWAGALEDTTKVKVTLSDSVKATWEGKGKIQTKVTFGGGLIAYGQAVEFVVGEILE